MLTNQSPLTESDGGTMSISDSRWWLHGESSESSSIRSSSVSNNEEEGRCVALLLPHEVIMKVFSQLDYLDLIHCSLACKQWHSEAEELREGWKEEYWEACSVRGFIRWDTDPPRARFDAYIDCSPD